MATVQKRSRQARALSMLEKQLKSGEKTQKKTSDVKVPLTENDVKRLNKEIEILKTRVN
jgi:NAD(P)H-dependent FMN reductase